MKKFFNSYFKHFKKGKFIQLSAALLGADAATPVTHGCRLICSIGMRLDGSFSRIFVRRSCSSGLIARGNVSLREGRRRTNILLEMCAHANINTNTQTNKHTRTSVLLNIDIISTRNRTPRQHKQTHKEQVVN